MPGEAIPQRLRGGLVMAVTVALWCSPGLAHGADGSPAPPAVVSLAQTENAEEVTAKLLPGEVSLVPGDVLSVDLLVTNTNPEPVTLTALDVRTPARVETDKVPLPGAIGPVQTNDIARTSFDVRALRGFEDGEVNVILQVQKPGADGGDQELVYASMSLSAGKATQALEVAFVSFPPKLNDGEEATAAVRISNGTPFPFDSLRMLAVDGEDVRFNRPAEPVAPFVDCIPAEQQTNLRVIGCLAELLPGEARVVPVTVQADAKVKTGTQELALAVAGRARTSGEALASEVLTTKEVELAIFGLDALSPFGAGTLFVLPGLLAVITFFLLYRYAYPRNSEVLETIEFKDPRLMVVVVPVSALVYLLILLTKGDDLTTRAGTSDVAWLFGLGMGLGSLAWIVLVVIYYHRSGRKLFTADDSPANVLARLDARDAPLQLPTLTLNGLNYRYLSDGPEDHLIVCSPIRYSFAAQADAASRARLQQAIQDEDIGVVRDEVSRGTVTLGWLLPSGVRLVKPEAPQLQPGQPLLVEA